MFLPLLLACSDYGLFGGKDGASPGTDPADPGDSDPTDTVTEVPNACDGVPVALPRNDVAATCTPVEGRLRAAAEYQVDATEVAEPAGGATPYWGRSPAALHGALLTQLFVDDGLDTVRLARVGGDGASWQVSDGTLDHASQPGPVASRNGVESQFLIHLVETQSPYRVEAVEADPDARLLATASIDMDTPATVPYLARVHGGHADLATDYGWWHGDTISVVPFLTQWGSDNGAYATDLDGDGGLDLLTSGGVQYASGREVYWPFRMTYSQIGVAANPDPVVVIASGWALLLLDAAGDVVWSLPFDGDDETENLIQLPAIGDATGDGIPEICAAFHAEPSGVEGRLVGLDGATLSTWPSGIANPSCSMADLDADGVYEVLWYDASGLRILDGRDGAEYWSDPSIGAYGVLSSVHVADVDLDGSAEIVVVGEERDGGAQVLRVYGAAQGRWARTRPVWNQRAYDIVSVNDDGTVPAFPFNAWEAYNAWRAQPAHDGDHPDLSVAATDVCVEDCTDGPVHLAVQVQNAGSLDADPGAVVRLWTLRDGTWSEVASAVVPEAIPAGTAPAGLLLTVSLADWGEAQALQVDGAGPSECDRMNDRVEIALAVCEGE